MSAFLRRRSQVYAVLCLLFLLVSLSLAACGVSTTDGAGSDGESQAGTTPTPAVSPSSSSSPTSTPSAQGVALSVDSASYTPSSTIVVTLANRGATNIIAFDHQTGCTILTLQRQVSGDWQPVGGCAMGRVTQQVTIPAGKTMQIKLTPGGGQIHPTLWPTGTYRVVLRFAPSQQGAASVVTTTLFSIR